MATAWSTSIALPQADWDQHQWLDYFVQQGEMYIFGYGSLMWKPEIDYDTHHYASAMGVARRYCIVSTHYRGTPERPGRVLGLTQSNSKTPCLGCVYHVRADKIPAAFLAIWQREMVSHAYSPSLIPVTLCDTPPVDFTEGNSAKTDQDTSSVKALAFLSNPTHVQYVDQEDPQDVAKIIARATGPMGTNRAYFFDTYDHLKELQVKDDYLERIAQCLHQLD